MKAHSECAPTEERPGDKNAIGDGERAVTESTKSSELLCLCVHVCVTERKGKCVCRVWISIILHGPGVTSLKDHTKAPL